MSRRLAVLALVVGLEGANAFTHTAGIRPLTHARSLVSVQRPKSPPLSSPTPKALRMAASRSDSGGALSKEVDVGLMGKWAGATGLQFGLICATLYAFDLVMNALSPTAALSVGPKVFASLFFAFMAIRSRVFSVLDNSRPTPPKKESDWKEVEVGKKREKFMEEVKRPDWMPPPKAFPVIWSTIGVLRCISSVLVWEAMGRTFFCAPLLALMAHLSIGDTWNTINNVERRKGTAAAVVTLVLVSAFNVIFAYYQVLPKAGLVLAPSGLWLSVATVLVWTIWRMNGAEPMLPYKA